MANISIKILICRVEWMIKLSIPFDSSCQAESNECILCILLDIRTNAWSKTYNFPFSVISFSECSKTWKFLFHSTQLDKTREKSNGILGIWVWLWNFFKLYFSILIIFCVLIHHRVPVTTTFAIFQTLTRPPDVWPARWWWSSALTRKLRSFEAKIYH